MTTWEVHVKTWLFEKSSGIGFWEWFQVKLQLGSNPLHQWPKDKTMTFHLILKSFQDSDHYDFGTSQNDTRGQRQCQGQIMFAYSSNE